jgi:phosphoketolase
MNLKTVAAIAALGAALSGCASIVEGTTQSIAVTTPSHDGAKCVLVNSEGTYYVTTPGNTRVHKTKHNLDVVCKMDGFKDGHVVVESHFNGATVGNIIAGGLIGVGVDAATGANFNYPDSIEVSLEPDNAAVAAPAADATPPSTVTAKPGS